ncbi:hypothetical protein ACFYW9_10405 [Streptomyces sp. NPDC002698]|uniref:hypothetical protein n=1 Tax=Streptomyces sp. NPDC002698 TaxID=3364660 RepID=UPI00368C1417
MPRSNGSSSDSEGSFTTAESGGSTISYTHATGSSAYLPNTGQVGVSASPATVSASPSASPNASPEISPPASPPPVPATDPPGQNPVGVFDVEAQTYLAADPTNSAVYRWSQGAQNWLSENREGVKRFAFDAVPLVLQAAGKGAQNEVGNYVNVVGVAASGVKSAAYLAQAGKNYYDTGDKAYLAQGVAAAVGVAGAAMSGYGNDSTLPVASQANWQAAGAGLQAGSATWNYSSPTAQQPAPADSASSTAANPTSGTTVNPTSVPAPTVSSSQPSQQPADQQQPPILPAGRATIDRQDSLATGTSIGSTSRPTVTRRTTAQVRNSTQNGNGTGGRAPRSG